MYTLNGILIKWIFFRYSYKNGILREKFIVNKIVITYFKGQYQYVNSKNNHLKVSLLSPPVKTCKPVNFKNIHVKTDIFQLNKPKL